MQPYYEDSKSGIVIYHGDCVEILPTLEAAVDCVITSPPYNLGGGPWPHLGNWRPGHASSGGKGRSKWRNGSDAANGIQYGKHSDTMPWPEYVAWQQSVLLMLWNKADVIFYNHKPRVIGAKLWTPLELIPEPVILRQIVTWARPGGLNYTEIAFVPSCEWIMVLAKETWRLKSKGVSGISDVWRMTPAVNNSHPAPFPIALPKHAIEAADAKSVLDPFMGSGTTLRAAKDMGASAIGIDTDERYCEMAANRLRQEVFDFA